MNPKELTVILKKEDKTYKEKFLIYEDFTVSPDDQTVKSCIQQAENTFKDVPEEVKIKVSAII